LHAFAALEEAAGVDAEGFLAEGREFHFHRKLLDAIFFGEHAFEEVFEGRRNSATKLSGEKMCPTRQRNWLCWPSLTSQMEPEHSGQASAEADRIWTPSRAGSW
jgi:hypothetical protein